MPFVKGKAPSDVNKRLSKMAEKTLPDNIKQGLYSMYQVLGSAADFFVPVDTTDLIKSKSFKITQSGFKFTLTYGYYTEYAAYLHESFNWNPRPVGAPGKKGNQWNPNAKPKWLDLAWKQSGKDAIVSFKAKL
jgi:hypothetical protein